MEVDAICRESGTPTEEGHLTLPASLTHLPVWFLSPPHSFLLVQRQLFEKKQRRKRQEPLMVQANPDASLRHRRPRRGDDRFQSDSSWGLGLMGFMGAGVRGNLVNIGGWSPGQEGTWWMVLAA